MNGGLAQYQFLPWVRQGLATRITGPSAQTPQRAGFQTTLRIKSKTDEPIQKQVELYGPGDITGFNSRIVIRTDPKPNISDFEPNYFPLIEFSVPDFPWRYTPLPVNGDNSLRLNPWICLIVLRAQPGNDDIEFKFKGRASGQPASSIEVMRQQKSLPDMSQSWAWAHVQVTKGEDEIIDLQEILSLEPERVVSRLLCPRRLEAGVLYHAFVVPTFESGRLTGLGMDPSSAAIDDPAWDASKDELIELPYYFDWEFRTGLRGDFEYLVRLLEPRELGKESGVGMQDVDCSAPGYDIAAVDRSDKLDDDPERHVVSLEGALWTVDAEPDPPHGEESVLGSFPPELTDLLNRPEDQLESAQDKYWVAPPIYGRWHAARKKLPGEGRLWLNELNTDPRHRTVAGFGTLIVQDEQEKLMAEAWRQIGAVNEANELLRQAQLGQSGSEKVYGKHVTQLAQEELIRITGPLHGRVLIDGGRQEDGGIGQVTLKHLLKGSPIPAAVLDPAFRRIFRRRGPLRKRQQEDVDADRSDILDRLNEGEIAGAGPSPFPDGAPGIGKTSEGTRPPWAQGLLWRLLKVLHWVLLALAVLLILVIGLLSLMGFSVSPDDPIVVITSAILTLLSIIVRRFIAPGLIAERLVEEELTPEEVRSADGRPDFQFDYYPGSDFSPGSTGTDNQDAQVFRAFAIAIQDFLNPPKEPEPEPIDLVAVRETLSEALDPRKTISERTKGRLRVAGVTRGLEGLETIMAAPEFHQPMYEPLRNRSQDYLLPGVKNIPQNTIALLKTNRRFIEAYMVGLNHEMARELLWREYPTDQRGSYFRQFWDVSRFVPSLSMQQELADEAESEAGDLWDSLSDQEKQTKITALLRERLKDIQPIHGWKDTELGGNSGRQDESLKEKLVLLIRGDLLKKYPTTVIYASKAETETKGIRWPFFDHEEEHRREAVFYGMLPPDITFLGFELDKDQARGADDPASDDQGWFFVVEEAVSETRFGMDAPPADPAEHSFDSWDQLSWENLPDSGLHPSKYINIGMDPPAEPPPEANAEGYTWDSDSAILARITVQKPVRIAVHADDMLPD